MTEQNVRKKILIFWIFWKKNSKIYRKTREKKLEEKGIDEVVESEDGGWIFTVIALNCIKLKRDVLWLLAKLMLRIKLTWSNLSTEVFLRFLGTSLEKTTIVYVENTSKLELYLDHKHSEKVINKKYKQRYIWSNDISGTSSLNVYVLQYRVL